MPPDDNGQTATDETSGDENPETTDNGDGAGDDSGTDWKAHARTWEDRAKVNSRRVAKIEKLAGADLDSIAETLTAAKEAGATAEAATTDAAEARAALTSIAPRLARAEIRTAAYMAGAADVDVIATLIEADSAEELAGLAGSDDLPDVVTARVAALLDAKPFLKGAPRMMGTIEGGVMTEETAGLADLSMDDYMARRQGGPQLGGGK